MKKLGIIGGAGPLASALFYEVFVQESYRQTHHMPEILLINFPFTRGLSLQEGYDNEHLILQELSHCVKTLVQHSVDIGILACNTLHLYLQRLLPLAIPFLPVPQLVMQEAKSQGHHRLLLLGTQNTSKSHLYHHEGMTLVYPSQKEQQQLDAVIDRVLIGSLSQEDSHCVSMIISHAANSLPIDGVILGCTDLPVLHHHYPIVSDKPIYDSIKIPAKIVRGYL